MKKILLGIATVSAALALLVSCGGEKTTTTPSTTPAVSTPVTSTPVGSTPAVTTPVQTTPVQTTGTNVTTTDNTQALENVKFESKTVEYTGNPITLTAENVPANFTVQYEGNTGTEAGVYKAKAKIYDAKGTLVKELRAILTIDNPTNAEFEEFCDQFFLDYLGNDSYAWNIFVIDQKAVGYDRPEDFTPAYYTYTKFDADYKEAVYNDYHGYLLELEEFADDRLSIAQKASYDCMYEMLYMTSKFYAPDSKCNDFMDTTYIDQFGGYVANFADTCTGYIFRTEQDVKDIISYIKSTDEAFASYLNFAKDKTEAGYPYTDYTLTEMQGYLDSIEEAGTEYYLYTYFKNTLDAVTFLDDAKKTQYYQEISDALTNDFLPGVKALNDGLDVYYGTNTSTELTYYMSYGEAGKEAYELALEDLLGYYDMNIEDYIDYLDTMINKYSTLMNKTIARINMLPQASYSSFSRYLNGQSMTGLKTPEEMLEYLKEFAKTIVPELKTTPNIAFSYMDDTVASITNTVAYYTKSPVDSFDFERITLNPVHCTSDYNDTLSTIAHEGYPGHLYEYVFAKELGLNKVATIMTNTGHGEGWATYVQTQLYDYVAKTLGKNSTTNAIYNYCEYAKYNQLISYPLYARIDVAVNYQGWNLAQVANYMNQLGFNGDAASEISLLLAEIPTQYASYGFGQLKMVELHDNAREALGEYYDEIEFNAYILSQGWCGLEKLEKLANQYVENMKFIYGLDAE